MTYCEWDIADDADRISNEKQRRFKCALRINKETGRVQWCAGSKFIKMLIILPATLLPVVLVLLLLTHLELVGSVVQPQKHSYLTASSSAAEQNSKQHFATLINDNALTDAANNDVVRDVDDKPTKSFSSSSTSSSSTKQCMAIRYSMSESVDNEDRDLLKDVRTSFIPPESIFVPPNCQLGGGDDDEWPIDNNNNHNKVNHDEIAEESISFRQALRDYGENMFPSFWYRQRRKRAENGTVVASSDNEARVVVTADDEDEEKSKNENNDEELLLLTATVDEVNIPASVHAFWKGEGMCVRRQIS